MSILSTAWSVEDVNRNFLERAGLGYMAEQFSVNKITGKCLMLLTEVGLNYIWDMPGTNMGFDDQNFGKF